MRGLGVIGLLIRKKAAYKCANDGKHCLFRWRLL